MQTHLLRSTLFSLTAFPLIATTIATTAVIAIAMITLLLTAPHLFAAPAAATVAIIENDSDYKKQTTIHVTGVGSQITLAEIQSAIAATTTTYVVHSGNGLWYLDVNLVIGEGVTLNLSPATGVSELRLRSGSIQSGSIQSGSIQSGSIQSGSIQSESHRAGTLPERILASNRPDTPSAVNASIDYDTFVLLKAQNGIINIDNVKIYSWDTDAQAVDQDETNGRAYILARDASTLTIRNSDIGYLGAKDGESYGISWRDGGEENGEFLTRVTGEVINSKIHHNYYGIYTYQAQNMTFRGNEFYENIRYGFDPHDYSHHILVEDNVAHHNGAHGFIISRGCNNFVFRNNISYGNSDPGSNLAHGFMLDPGGANIDKPQVSSSNNLLVGNEAYDNEGYGLRVLGSSDNTIRANNFHHNQMGISIDEKSNRNQVIDNLVEDNERYGFFIRDNLANEIVGNQINRNGRDGASLSKSAKDNQLLRNTIAHNSGFGIAVSGSSTTGNNWSQNSIFDNQDGGIDDRVRKLSAPELLSVATNRLEGSAKAGATVELFANDNANTQGARYIGSTTADGSGKFVYTASSEWGGSHVTAIALDANGNASTFSEPLAVSDPSVPTATATVAGLPTPTPTVEPTVTSPATVTPTATSITPTETALATPSATPTAAPSQTATATGTRLVPTATVMATATDSLQPSTTPTATPTATATPQGTPGGTGINEQTYLPLILGR